MAAPAAILGVVGGPPKDPGRLPNMVNASGRVLGGGSGGGGGGGLTPNPIRAGLNVAFGSPHNAEAPLWQNVNDLGPT